MLRLHSAGFAQGSWYLRNILKQPGPLSLPPSRRSLETPSFRVIDFGRGTEGSRYTGATVNRWFELTNDEDRKAQEQLGIVVWDY